MIEIIRHTGLKLPVFIWLLVFTLTFSANDANAQSSVSNCPINSALAAYYPFDGDNGDFLKDQISGSSGSNSAVSKVNGIVGSAIRFNQSSVVVAARSDLALNNKLTIALWVKPNNLESAEARFVSKAFGVEDAEHYLMAGTISGDALRFRLKTGSGNGVTRTLVSDGGLLQVDKWSHVVFTYDGQAMRIFHNAELVAQVAESGAISAGTGIPMALGNQPTGAGDRPFLGDMDDVRIYGEALSEDDVSTLMSYRLGSCTESEQVVEQELVHQEQELIQQEQGLVQERDSEAPSTPVSSRAPSAPSNVQALQVSPEQAVLGWEGSVDSESMDQLAFEIRRNNQILGSVLNANRFIDTDVQTEVEYSYSVRAVNSDGIASSWTDIAAFTIPAAEILEDPASSEQGIGLRVSGGAGAVGIELSVRFLGAVGVRGCGNGKIRCGQWRGVGAGHPERFRAMG